MLSLRRLVLLGAAGAAAIALGGCSGSSTSKSTAPVPTWSKADQSTSIGVTPVVAEAPAGWTIGSTGALGAAVLLKVFTASSGHAMEVAKFPIATTAFHLHVGSGDPPGSSAKAPTDSDPSVSATEAPMLVAAFNGAFKIEAQAGGMMVDGITVSPMLPNKAAAVIYDDGSLDVGVWGVTVPAKGRTPVAARENLQLLVDNGAITEAARSNSEAVWGASVSGAVSARSGVGVDKEGNVYYAASMGATALDVAEALQQAGVVRGMQFDMNPAWISLGVAERPGATLMARVPGENLSPSVFIGGWSRDFVAVLAKPNRSCRLVFPTPAGLAGPNPPTQRCAPASVHGAP